jgi:hypothetical protein
MLLSWVAIIQELIPAVSAGLAKLQIQMEEDGLASVEAQIGWVEWSISQQ